MMCIYVKDSVDCWYVLHTCTDYYVSVEFCANYIPGILIKENFCIFCWNMEELFQWKM